MARLAGVLARAMIVPALMSLAILRGVAADATGRRRDEHRFPRSEAGHLVENQRGRRPETTMPAASGSRPGGIGMILAA
jgi:hypothetical protein